MFEPSPVQFLQHPPQLVAAKKQYGTGEPASPKPQAKGGPSTPKSVIDVWQNATRPRENPMKQHRAMRHPSCSGNHRMAPTARENGFSLIELMIVSGIIAILAGIAIPSIGGAIRQYGVITATQEVAAALRSARVQAVGRNQRLRVEFGAEAGTYQVWNVTADPDVAIGPLFNLPTGTEFVDADTDVEFSTSGRLQDPGLAPLTIVVGNGDDDQNRTITVSASGRVQLP